MIEKNENESVNGVLFSVHKEDLKKIDKRENVPKLYTREKVKVHPLHTQDDTPEYAWVYLKNEPVNNKGKNILPYWKDLVYARRAAYNVSNDFGEFFDQTTYLCDRETLVADLYKKKWPAKLSFDPPPKKLRLHWTDDLERKIIWCILLLVFVINL